MNNNSTQWIQDRDFIRGDVPMTKQEVRWTTLVKMKLTSQMVFLDIGGGSGSVSVQAAKILDGGKV
ncbi:MAG TPA: precorrin-6Y C5,15-methyltransferase (decarboxylating) subunit CbiT, partial [Eubacteriaceae bacterium]|nr:precorrin-6Y C5,15-methyltransferase (decarboxylating) subunit CbiT [Eubacteriaceae bacterium]